ncbi:MAG: hypothetical protein FWF54_01990, partial [Candidatus Azobacteroides sp.]|nr:hypothetical protein [Candidatus Azobacteroides sp.]
MTDIIRFYTNIQGGGIHMNKYYDYRMLYPAILTCGGVKNVVFRPVRDNILVEWKIPPDTKVPSGTKCFLLHITS